MAGVFTGATSAYANGQRPAEVLERAGQVTGLPDELGRPSVAAVHGGGEFGEEAVDVITGDAGHADDVAPPVAIVPLLRIFITFRGLKAQADPVAEIVQCGEPIFSITCGRRIFRRSFTVPFPSPFCTGFSLVIEGTRMLAQRRSRFMLNFLLARSCST